ncbi:MAG: UDP-N-acetylglucosamine 4,6-dehydratase (inverting) [Alphaproteobacteria bacterium MarineAlpha5_Bin8]|nr:MAG: UDP-N-acetylglucosamine 4,6-dehydratase (inverting) [Alphaproteobacteria bacterium MarineAlpha5_Bin8]PPR54158.1 MAG: UDP-N-acetylglucosamine 4,6-dehydratase (inverting) [Alphaproteobacteria bacterium MarineAlpha5_Bin6]|tara:strand:- start:3868 stop:4932 length:1065 start_codon:yes stop_codon:yes gene_type:complete
MDKSIFNNKSILITGGTGSFGYNFAKEVLLNHKPKKIVIYSRDEYKQYKIQNANIFKKFTQTKNNSNILRFFIGDIRDKDRLKFAVKDNIDYVIHASALKQVPTCEYNPFEAVKTNILGAQNLIEACLESNVKKVIALSTDKAASPINLYGATKLTSDKLFIAANYYKGKKDIKFSVVRYGNVMGSRGSVIPLFLSLKGNKEIPITDKRMTRFNITLSESVKFVIYCLKNMWGGELFVPKLPSYHIMDLLNSISPNSKVKIIGIRSGEKIHEEMISSADSINTIDFKDYYVILPSENLVQWNIKKFINSSSKIKGKYCEEGFCYNSKDNSSFLSVNQIKKLISLNHKSFFDYNK